MINFGNDAHPLSHYVIDLSWFVNATLEDSPYTNEMILIPPTSRYSQKMWIFESPKIHVSPDTFMNTHVKPSEISTRRITTKFVVYYTKRLKKVYLYQNRGNISEN